MKILYDNQIFSLQNFGGISRYFYELIRALSKEINYDLPVMFSNNHYIRNKDITYFRTFFPDLKFQGKTTLIKFFNHQIQKRYFKSDFDIFHPTYYNPYFLDSIGDKPFVLNIHDMTHEIYSLKTSKDDWSISGKKILAEKSNQIIAVSENTKKDVVERLHINPDKIKVIHLGCSLTPSSEKAINLPNRFLLFVGERSGYKNFANLAKAFSIICKSDPELKLVVTGKPFFQDELKLLSSLGIEKSTFHFIVNDEAFLSQLYSAALSFIFPSMYEGFGLPILEAFASDCPVILSDSSCFPEVAGNAGEYFNPVDIDSIVESIKHVIYDDSYRNELINLGKKRAGLFSWEKSAMQTLQLYHSILDTE
ncbi:MAG: glycosyltransferase family 4 protein [Dysgonamonadaceae bacterium]|jgi:glycosyltransferase involved in cell wall biosynthesis|nr:glycosyltransferase family 4 protein [Dysgonamonadaceae bacterium]